MQPTRLSIAAIIALMLALVYAASPVVYRFRHALFGSHSLTAYRAVDMDAPISIELDDAPPAGTSKQRAGLWLRRHRTEIAVAAWRTGIDCRAIGGTIAFEALEDPMWTTLDGFARWSGPGKVHFKEHYAAEGDPVAKQVEELGYLPRLTMEERRRTLRTAGGAALYIGAIMRAFADAVKSDGDISRRPAVLATLYSGWDLHDARRYFRSGRVAREETRINAMGLWVGREAPFLEDALGRCVRR